MVARASTLACFLFRYAQYLGANKALADEIVRQKKGWSANRKMLADTGVDRMDSEISPRIGSLT